MAEGLRVIKGRNFCLDNQDDVSEGGLGTVIKRESDAVVVLWDHGVVSKCKIGKDHKFDLLVYDSSPAGVHHFRDLCSNCYSKLWGIKWSCSECSDISLCCSCYNSDIHKTDHAFFRLDHPTVFNGLLVRARSRSKKLELKGIFANSRVVRGLHWEWLDQDGSKGNRGTVLEIKSWKDESGRSIARVCWDGGITNSYRAGHLGMVDLRFVSSPPGKYYCYHDHLPNLSSSYLEMLEDRKSCQDQTELLSVYVDSSLIVKTGQQRKPSLKGVIFPNSDENGNNLVHSTIDHHQQLQQMSGCKSTGGNPVGPALCNERTSSSLLGSPEIDASSTTEQPSGQSENLSTKIDLQEILDCPICLEKKVNVAFQCGHLTCEQCSKLLKFCHMCMDPVTQRLNIYF